MLRKSIQTVFKYISIMFVANTQIWHYDKWNKGLGLIYCWIMFLLRESIFLFWFGGLRFLKQLGYLSDKYSCLVELIQMIDLLGSGELCLLGLFVASFVRRWKKILISFLEFQFLRVVWSFLFFRSSVLVLLVHKVSLAKIEFLLHPPLSKIKGIFFMACQCYEYK